MRLRSGTVEDDDPKRQCEARREDNHLLDHLQERFHRGQHGVQYGKIPLLQPAFPGAWQAGKAERHQCGKQPVLPIPDGRLHGLWRRGREPKHREEEQLHGHQAAATINREMVRRRQEESHGVQRAEGVCSASLPFKKDGGMMAQDEEAGERLAVVLEGYVKLRWRL